MDWVLNKAFLSHKVFINQDLIFFGNILLMAIEAWRKRTRKKWK